MPDQVREAGTLERAISETKTAALTACEIPQGGDTADFIERAKAHLAAADVQLSLARRVIDLRGREPERGDGPAYSQLRFYPKHSNIDP